MNNQGFTFRKRLHSFGYAIKGLRFLWCGDNARIQLSVALIAIILAWWLHCSTTEWAIIIICIGGVLGGEAFNTALETLADRISQQYDPLVGRAKDLAAGAVLLWAIASVGAGLLIFTPKLMALTDCPLLQP